MPVVPLIQVKGEGMHEPRSLRQVWVSEQDLTPNKTKNKRKREQCNLSYLYFVYLVLTNNILKPKPKFKLSIFIHINKVTDSVKEKNSQLQLKS